MKSWLGTGRRIIVWICSDSVLVQAEHYGNGLFLLVLAQDDIDDGRQEPFYLIFVCQLLYYVLQKEPSKP
jgi:hypothetical protein